MTMKSKLGMVSMLSAMAMIGLEGSNRIQNFYPMETDEEKKQRRYNAEIKRKKANGLKEFFYGENSLYALNQKNADKKARKMNWL